jgi:hypothetical protein
VETFSSCVSCYHVTVFCEIITGKGADYFINLFSLTAYMEDFSVLFQAVPANGIKPDGRSVEFSRVTNLGNVSSYNQ